MTDVRRGEVWLTDFGDSVGHEQGGRRPSVVVSSDQQNTGPSGIVVVVPVTTTPRPRPSHIELDPGRTGLDEVSYATCEHLKSISDERLIGRIGVVGPDSMFAMARAIRILLDL